jgi:hypothetical protein
MFEREVPECQTLYLQFQAAGGENGIFERLVLFATIDGYMNTVLAQNCLKQALNCQGIHFRGGSTSIDRKQFGFRIKQLNITGGR